MYFYISFNLLSAGRSQHGVTGLETLLQGNFEAAAQSRQAVAAPCCRVPTATGGGAA